MKKCTYCGKEWPDEVDSCLLDGQPVTDSAAPVKVSAKPTENKNSNDQIKVSIISPFSGGVEEMMQGVFKELRLSVAKDTGFSFHLPNKQPTAPIASFRRESVEEVIRRDVIGLELGWICALKLLSIGIPAGIVFGIFGYMGIAGEMRNTGKPGNPLLMAQIMFGICAVGFPLAGLIGGIVSTPISPLVEYKLQSKGQILFSRFFVKKKISAAFENKIASTGLPIRTAPKL